MFAVLVALAVLFQAVSAQFHLSLDKNSYGGGDSVKVSWTTTGSVLKLGDLKKGTLDICTCNASNTFTCSDVKDNIDLTTDSVEVPVSSFSDIGPSGMYMFQLTAINPDRASEYAISYSGNFVSISGMTGDGKAGSTCNVPSDTDNNVPGTGTASSSTISWTSYSLPKSLQTISSYLIPYTWQKGPTRVAPFQLTPGTKVTEKTTPTRRFPTSSYSPFSTYVFNKFMPLTTLTPSPQSPAVQEKNYASTIATTPSGYQPTRVLPSLGVTSLSSSSSGRARKRWVD